MKFESFVLGWVSQRLYKCGLFQVILLISPIMFTIWFAPRDWIDEHLALWEERNFFYYYHYFTAPIKNELNDFNEILIEDWCRLDGWDKQCEILIWHHNRDPLKERYKGRHYSKLLYSSGLSGKSSSKQCWGQRSIILRAGFHANEKMLSSVS